MTSSDHKRKAKDPVPEPQPKKVKLPKRNPFREHCTGPIGIHATPFEIQIAQTQKFLLGLNTYIHDYKMLEEYNKTIQLESNLITQNNVYIEQWERMGDQERVLLHQQNNYYHEINIDLFKSMQNDLVFFYLDSDQ